MKALYIPLILAGIYIVFQSFKTIGSLKTEKQAYRLVKKEAGFEIRYYPSATMATVYSKGTNYKSVTKREYFYDSSCKNEYYRKGFKHEFCDA
jgi:hypothetical protein